MERGYEPKDLEQMAFDELNRFFRSSSEVNNFLNNEESIVLTWYFTQSSPMPNPHYDPVGYHELIEMMGEELGGSGWKWKHHWQNAMMRLRARHRCLIFELNAGVDPSQMKAFLPWHEWPRGAPRP